MERSLMIVEDESTLLAALTRGLESLPGVNVHGCPSGEDAIAFLSQEIPDLILLDINLPGLSGLDVLEDLVERDIRVPVVVTTAYRKAYSDQLSQHTHLTILEKPVPLQELRGVVQGYLARSVGADLGPFEISDYLQLASLGRHSLVLRIEAQGTQIGRVEIVGGEIWNAFSGQLRGREALERLLAAPQQKINFSKLKKPPGARQLYGSSEALLLDIAREQDESAAVAAGYELGNGTPKPALQTQQIDTSSLPLETNHLDTNQLDTNQLDTTHTDTTPSQAPVQPSANGESFDRLFSSAMRAYLERRHDAALAILETCHELRPHDERVLHNIERIKIRRNPS